MSTTARPAQLSAARRIPASPWTLAALALGVGLVGGAATSFGQTVLSGGWHALVNSTAPWATVAFLVGLRAAGHWRRAAVAGVLSQLGLLAGYYVTAELRGYPTGLGAVVIWAVAGVVAGPVYGAAGALLRADRRLLRAVATGLTGSAWGADGLRFLWLASDAQSNSGPGATAGWSFLLISVLLPVALARSARDRVYALLVLIAGVGAVAVASLVIDQAFML
ncbi:DUF6518 family protein [Nonomuraea maritima]|uniref:DUF6518 family protein n=1 Tax=Nonomuraea maritima TaxID=683260 RepID=UPI0037159B13